MATITDSSVAMIEMPKELRSAVVNSESEKTVSKLSHDQSSGQNFGEALLKVAGSLNESDTIHTRGNSAHKRMPIPATVHQRSDLWRAISGLLALATDRS